MSGRGINTLVVAPKSDLPRAETEAVAVANLLPGYLLQGEVTVDGLLNQAERGKWDIIWFATHGDEYGVVLSDGHLSTSALTTLVRTSGADLIVLNTCSSLQVALAMHNELLTDFICTIRPVPDLSAYLTGKQFALHLSRGMTPINAYLNAKPGQNVDYIFLPGRIDHVPVLPTTTNKASPARYDWELALAEIWDELKRIAVLIDGKESWGQTGLRRTVTDLQASIQGLVTHFNARMIGVEKKLDSFQIVLWLMVTIALALLVTIAGVVVWG